MLLNQFPRKRTGVPGGWTSLCQNSNYGLRVAKSLSFLMSFSSPSYFLTNDCCFACFSFHIPVLSFPPFFSFIFPYLPFCPALPLSKSSWAIPLQVPSSAYFFLHFYAFSSHVLPFPPAFSYLVLSFIPILLLFVRHYSSQNPVEHARSKFFLQHTSFPFPLPFSPALSCIVDFTLACWFYLYRVCSCVFLPFCFTGVFLEIIFMIDDLFFFLFGSCLSKLFAFNLLFSCVCLHLFSRIFLINLFVLDYFLVCSMNLLHQLCLFAFLL